MFWQWPRVKSKNKVVVTWYLNYKEIIKGIKILEEKLSDNPLGLHNKQA
jgi:hypothetical protein